jgi:LuxR family maltose regulon positive regulatory protein
MLLIEIPHLTLATTLIARGTPDALQQVAELLARLRQFVEETHNTWRLIEVLSLQALLHNAQGERKSALESLAQALDLAQPGGFIRLFVDLGPQMADLLADLKTDDSGRRQHIDQILAAFGQPKPQSPLTPTQPLIEPLTHREQDVLNLLGHRLSDKEIARRLVISRNTVKTHTKGVFSKLNVKNRRQAVARARELGLLSSE